MSKSKSSSSNDRHQSYTSATWTRKKRKRSYPSRSKSCRRGLGTVIKKRRTAMTNGSILLKKLLKSDQFLNTETLLSDAK